MREWEREKCKCVSGCVTVSVRACVWVCGGDRERKRERERERDIERKEERNLTYCQHFDFLSRKPKARYVQ